MQNFEQYGESNDGGYDDDNPDEAVVTSAAGTYNLELRAIYYLHNGLCQQMAQVQDEYVAFPLTSWQVTAVEIMPFRTLDERYAQNTIWGILDFADQPGGAFAFLDTHAAMIVTGVGEEELQGEEGMSYMEQWLQHLGLQFMDCWQEIAQFDVQMFPSPTAPPMSELAAMFPGLNANTPIITTAFRVVQPGQGATARVVLAIPQAYLLAVGPSLQSVGEMTMSSNDTTYFHERLDYIEEVPIAVTVLLGKVELTVGDLQGIEEGDVIELGTTLGQPLEMRVGSIHMKGKPGTSADGRRLAVQIVEMPL